MVKLLQQESDALGDAFLEYLDTHDLKRTTSKPELKEHYLNFRLLSVRARTSYSTLLYHMSRRQRNIRVRDGHVYFKGTPDWSQSSMKVISGSMNPKSRKHRDEIFDMLRSSKARDLLLHARENTVKVTCIPAETQQMFGYYTFEAEDGGSNEFEICVQNISYSDITLRKCLTLRDSQVISLSDPDGCTKLPDPTSVVMSPGATFSVTVKCSLSAEVGSYCSDVFFNFRDSEDCDFLVMRYLRCIKSDDITRLLGPLTPYCKRRPEARVNFTQTLPGEKIEFTSDLNQLRYQRELDLATPPKQLREALREGAFNTDEAEKMKPPRTLYEKNAQELLVADLDIENYGEKFSLLLHLEELQAERDIHVYDLRNVTLNREGRKFLLTVPGLAERRPSILRGDKIYFMKVGPDGNPYGTTRYEGYVHDVRLDEVLIGLNRKLAGEFLPGMKFNVSFTFNRLPLKLQHRAVLNTNNSENSLNRYEKSLFPEIVNDPNPGFPLKIVNKNVEQNPQQRKAVESIFYGNTRCPYIIFGPPGTGKTVTMVEAIYQIASAQPHAHLLVCAPSNSACDLMVERLLGHVDKAWILRMYAMSRPLKEIPEKVKPVCNYSDTERDFFYPSREKLKTYRIIATTLITAGRISSACFPKEHFDFVFVDEAGHAVESEVMIAVENILSPYGRIVLAGDPHQLGPIVRSKVAKKFGLDRSYLERLMEEQEIYEIDSDDADELDDRVITRLVRNYRSHETIIHIPNELFYENALEVHADKFAIESCCHWEYLAKQNFPIIFHGVKGEDVREGNSPSFFNPQEASVVFDYVQKLLATRRNPVRPHEIGIISPYRKQVQKIRKAMESKKLEGRKDIKVGSVEEFQGQERRVIIISTVRSDSHHLLHDQRFHLGFLQNPKRFNVAITRAKALLIVIGNPGVLCKDYNWKRFLDYCKDKGGTKGIFYEPEDVESNESEGSNEDDDDNDVMDELTTRMKELELSNLQKMLGPEWRNEM